MVRPNFWRARPSRRYLALCAALLGAPGGYGCKRDPAPSTDSQQHPKPNAAAAATSSAPDPIRRLERSGVLAHVMMPNASRTLNQLNQRSTPAIADLFTTEQKLRQDIAAGLGGRDDVAKNTRLDAPIGCVLVDSSAAPIPVACVSRYTGGVDALISDLGAEGRQSDTEDHDAYYILLGQQRYIDELDGAVVTTNHGDLFGVARDYIAKNVLARHDSASDIEIVLYSAAALARYKDFVEPWVAQATQPLSDADNDSLKPVFEQLQLGLIELVTGAGQVDQLTIDLGIEPVGLVARYAVFATPHSQLGQNFADKAATRLDRTALNRLPPTTWLALTSRIDPGLWEAARLAAKGYTAATGDRWARRERSFNSFVAEFSATYVEDVALALIHEPGSAGAVVFTLNHRPGRAQAPTNDNTAETFREALKPVLSWSSKANTTTIDGVAVDRWTLTPSAATIESLRAVMGSRYPALGARQWVVHRAEVEDRTLFVIATNDDKTSVHSVIQAAKAGPSLAESQALQATLGRRPNATSLLAVDAKGASQWLGAVAGGKPPWPPVGTDFSDIHAVLGYQKGSHHGEFVLSQALIDQFKATQSRR